MNRDRIFPGGTLAAKGSEIYASLAKLTKRSPDAERLAARRYAIQNDLFTPAEPAISDEEIYTTFGDVKESSATHQVDISGKDLFYNPDEKRDKTQTEYSGPVIKLTFEATRYPCCWSYGRLFKSNGEIKLHAVCLNEGCDALKIIHSENCQTKLNISIVGFDGSVQHTKRKYVTSDDKGKISSLLDVESAMVAHAKLANEYIFADNKYAAHLPSTAALRQRKYRKSLGRRHALSPVAVAIMKREGKYRQYIFDIGLDPFYVIYRSPLQKQFLVDQCKKERCVISIDATGVNIKPPKFGSISERSRKSMKPFLYIITLHTQSHNVPIHQMVSQRHSHEFLAYFLTNWKHRHNNGRSPHEVIMDESQALIVASVQAFTSSRTKEDYMSRCYDALFNNTQSPECFRKSSRK